MTGTAVPVEVGIVVTKTITLVLGGLIATVAWRAYRRTGERSLRALSVGFGVVTVGLLAAGVGDLVLGVATTRSVFLEGALTTVGLAVIVYSLYAR